MEKGVLKIIKIHKFITEKALKSKKITFIDKIKSLYKNLISNVYFYCETRIFSQDEVDTLLMVFQGSIKKRIKLLVKRIFLFYKNIFNYRLIIIKNKFVYIIGLNGIKKELSDESIYLYLTTIENKGE